MARFNALFLATIVAAVATAAFGCPSQQYFSSDYSKGGGGSSTAATTTGTGGKVPCSDMMPCMDEGNPCTAESCPSGTCEHTPLTLLAGPESTECKTIACVNGASTPPVFHENAACGMGLKCNAAGQCAGCKDATECPAPTADCQVASCEAMVCTSKPAPKGTPSTKVANPPTDCKKPLCDGNGDVELVNDDAEMPIVGLNPCTDPTCIKGAPMYPASATGKACTSASNPKAKFCDGASACVECVGNASCTVGTTPSCDPATHTCISCSDGVQNGPETGKDCGGLCPKCDGDLCGQGPECKSLKCDDAVCCNMSCMGTCVACDLPGEGGKCSFVAKGLQDSQCSGGAKACDGNGACASGVTGRAGVPCVADGDCYAGACNGVCRLANLAPCSDDAECASLHCNANVCTACSGPGDCASSQCSAAMRCLVPGGGICNVNGDCAGGTCDLPTHLCGKSLMAGCATASDCATHYCTGMNQCAPCTMDGDCVSQKCDTVFGICLLPTDAPCTADLQCKLGTCYKTFPRKCK